jgi:hypothetical protein
MMVLPPALWSGRNVEFIFGAGVNLWTDASCVTLERGGWVPPLIARWLEEEHCLFCPARF